MGDDGSGIGNDGGGGVGDDRGVWVIMVVVEWATVVARWVVVT